MSIDSNFLNKIIFIMDDSSLLSTFNILKNSFENAIIFISKTPFFENPSVYFYRKELIKKTNFDLLTY